MFITKTDIQTAIRSEELTQITRGDDTMINTAISVAISEMISYLKPNYDTVSIFSQIGTNRHALLLNFGIDIAIYVLLSVALPGQDLEDRRARYKRAIDWLKQLKANELNPDLPEPAIIETANTTGKIGEHTKRPNHF